MEGGDSHDERLVRVRESLQRGNHIDRGVRNVVVMVTSLASRIGPVHNDQGVPRLILRQQWSALNEPLMWAAAAGDSENLVLLWLADECSRGGPVLVAGVDTAGRDAVFEAWHALSGAMRSWGTQSREDLSEWIHRQGFVQPRWGGHFSGRAQERILTTAALTDARVSALESTYVQVVLRACGQTTPREAPHNGASSRPCASGRQDESVANHLDRLLGSHGRCQFARSVPGEIFILCKAAHRVSGEGTDTHVGKFWKFDTKQSIHATN